MNAVAAEYSEALGRTISYVDVPFGQWRDELRKRNLPIHVLEHLQTMAQLHAANRYDRITKDVETITGTPATSISDFVAQHASRFAPG
jgi:NAD(P)H dehydrogenase (quinone)